MTDIDVGFVMSDISFFGIRFLTSEKKILVPKNMNYQTQTRPISISVMGRSLSYYYLKFHLGQFFKSYKIGFPTISKI